MTKKKKLNLLITCAGGSSSIYSAKKLKNKHNIHLADASKDSVAPHLGFPFQIIPFGKHLNYTKRIDTLVKKWNINCIVPGADEELVPISKYCQKNKDILSVIPSLKFINNCLNKKKCMAMLHRSNISSLLPIENQKKIKFPIFVKPIYGRGSREAHKIETGAQLGGYLKLYNKQFNEILAQPYIGGEEYTVSVITNNLNKLIGIVSKKIIIKKGITKVAVTEINSLIEKICIEIVREFQPCGPFNVQLKIFNNKVYIFEINPRLSTTSVLTDVALGNEIDLFIKYYNCNDIGRPPKMKKDIFLYRYDENYFKY